MASTPSSPTYAGAVQGPARENNFPFRAKSDWNPGSNSNNPQKNTIPLKQGDEGRFDFHDPSYLKDPERYHRERKTIWARVTITRRAREIVNIVGIVPKDYLEIGTERRYGEYITELVSDTTVPASIQTSSTGSLPRGDVLFQTACVLMEDIKSQIPYLETLSAEFVDALGAPGDRTEIIRIANFVTSGLQSNLKKDYEKLLKKDFSWSQIKKAGRKIDSSIHKTGIYSWTHSDFTNDSTRAPKIAIGSTGDLGARYSSHHQGYTTSLRKFKNGEIARMAPQYDAWRLTNSHEMVALAVFTGDVPESILRWCELLLIILFETYDPCFYSPDQSDVNLPETTEDGHEEQDLQVDDSAVRSTMPPTMNAPSAVKSTFSSTDMKVLGTKLAGMSKTIFKRTGWVGGCNRPSFGGSGANWHSPGLGSDSQGVCLTKITVPGVMDTYRRSPITAVEQTQNRGVPSWIAIHHMIRGILRASFPKEEAAKVGIFPGTKVHTVFEIMHKGAHPTPWSRLSEVPEFADEGEENIANRLGVRLEWPYIDKKTGELTWGKIYVQTPLTDEYAIDRPSRAYTIAIATIRCLQMEVLTVYPPWFLRTPGRLHIREVKFNFLRQVLTIEEHKVKTMVPPPVRIPTSERMKELERRGAKNIGPRPKHSGARCDNCLMHSVDWDGEWISGAEGPKAADITRTYRCVITTFGKEGDPKPCKRCGEMMRLMCSFSTKNQDPRELPDRLRAGLVSMKAQVSLLATFDIMDDPQLQSMPTRTMAVNKSILSNLPPNAPTTATQTNPPANPSTATDKSTTTTPRNTSTSSGTPSNTTLSDRQQREIRIWNNRITPLEKKVRDNTGPGLTAHAPSWLELFELMNQIFEIPNIPSNGYLRTHRQQWLERINGVLDESREPDMGAQVIDNFTSQGDEENLYRAVVTVIRWVRRDNVLGTPPGAVARRECCRLRKWLSDHMPGAGRQRNITTRWRDDLNRAHNHAGGLSFSMTWTDIDFQLKDRLPTVNELKAWIKAKPQVDKMRTFETWLKDMGYVFGEDVTSRRKVISDYTSSEARHSR